MLALSLGCAAAPAPAPKAPAPSNEELSRLRAENEALVRRVEELEAERDRLRAKAEPMAVLAEAPAQGEEAVEEAAEGASTVPVVAGLPVVKLVPNPRASGSEAVEAETPEARPVLRVHGEEEGTVSSGREATRSSAGRSPVTGKGKS